MCLPLLPESVALFSGCDVARRDIYLHTYIHTQTHTYIYIYIYTHINIHIHTHMYTHIYDVDSIG